MVTARESVGLNERIQNMSKVERRAWFYFLFMLLVISWQAFSVAPLGNAISLSHFSKHAMAMSLLCGLLHYAMLVRGDLSNRTMRWRIFAAIFAYGLFIELVHAFLPWRSAELIDLVADLTGIVLYLCFVAVAQRIGLWPDFKST